MSLALVAGQAASTPVPPRLVKAQGLTDTTVQLAWTAEAAADTYRVYRDGGLVTQQPGTLYDDAGLLANSSHTYTVSTVSGGVESPLSTPATTQTQAPADTSPPSQPGSIIVSNITSDGADLDWGSSTDNIGIEGYRVLRGPVGTPPDQLKQISTNDSATSYTAVNLHSGTAYQYGVMAVDSGNNHSPIRTVTFTTASSSDTTPPAAPSSGGVRTIPFSSSRIDVIWPASTSTDVWSYRVYRDGVQVGVVENPLRKNFSDLGLTPGTSYTYTIRAVDSAGNLSPATTAKVGTTPATGTVLFPRGPMIQWVTPDSARIAWWTNIPTPSTVEYGVGGLTNSATDPVLRTQHMMLIGALTPGTSYQYRVGNGTVMSATNSFPTAASPGATFSFAAVGDFGGGGPGETDVANSISASTAQFTQTVGDNVYPDSQDPDFTTFYSDFDSHFFKQYNPVINHQAFWPADGNKEYYGDGAHWRNFWLPNNEHWYSYDWGDAHILSLDTEQPFTPGSPQYQFASADLSAHQAAKWRIAVVHRPPYSSSSNNSSSSSVQTNLVPLFEQQNVQLVFSGNSHNYERSYPLVGGVPATSGIVYVVTGGGGNGHNLFTIPQPAWSAYRDDVLYEYVRVTVSPQSLQLDAIRGDTGAIFDSSTITGPPGTGTIEVKKTLNPSGDSGRFNLQVDGQTQKNNASNGDTTGPVTVNTGTNHSVGELAGASTSLSDYSSQISCTRNGNPAESGSGTSLSGITVTTGDAVVCTITNARRGQVIVKKDAQPNDAQDFSFAAGGGLSPSSFSLDDDSDPTLSDTRTFDQVAPGSGYSVSETVPSGWDQTSATCDDGSSVANIDVSPGETVTCTFVNRKRGQIVVAKDAQPNDPQDFSFTAGGGLSPPTFSLDDDSDPTLPNTNTFSDVTPGSGYSVSETVPSGWDQSSATCDDGSSVANIDVSAGETVTCTFVNRKRGKVVVVKDAQPDDPQDFSFTAGGGLTPSSFDLDDDSDPTLPNTQTFNDVTPGSGYSVSETVPSGWDQASATCNDGSSVANIDVSAGETVTCTFVNRKRGKIVVVKDAQPDDAQDFSFTVGGGLSPSSFDLDDDSDPTLSNTQTFSEVTPGNGYSVSETVPSGWDQLSATCDDASPPSNISLNSGETVTCTFVNSKTYEIPNGASPFRASLVPAFDPCAGGADNAAHEPPLSGRSCSPPAPSSPTVAVGPDSLGFARLIVLTTGQCASFDPSHCYPDFTIRVNITDVRSASPVGFDYDPSGSPDLTAVATIPDYSGPATRGAFAQITDKNNKSDTGTLYNKAATVTPLSFPIPMDCTSTVNPLVGSTCNAQTTANTLVPGAAVAGKRAIWELGQLQVLDVGADGVPSGDDKAFEVEGVFVP